MVFDPVTFFGLIFRLFSVFSIVSPLTPINFQAFTSVVNREIVFVFVASTASGIVRN